MAIPIRLAEKRIYRDNCTWLLHCSRKRLFRRNALAFGDAPDFVEVGEAGIAVGDAMRRERRVQLVG